LCLFAVNILLSGRYHAIDWLFFGLDRAYRIHRRTGIIAFILMLTHVGVVTVRAAVLSLTEVVALWLDMGDKALVLGRFAFLGFFVIILITLFVKMPYELLKKSHQTLGLFLFLGGLHAYLIPSDMAVNQPLRWYVMSLTAIGVASYVWRTLLKPWLVPRQRFIITAVRKLNSNITEITMKPKSKNHFIFTPGQFNFYKFIQPGFPPEDHPFSITAGAHETNLRLSAKALGDFTTRLPELKKGAQAIIQGPYGGFTYQRGSPRQIWIAGGIGITPFMSMARTLRYAAGENTFAVDLFYSVESKQEAVYFKELQAIAREQAKFNVYLWVTGQNRFITAQAISEEVSLEGKDIFICGPPGMIETLTKQFKALKIPGRHIHSERFKLL